MKLRLMPSRASRAPRELGRQTLLVLLKFTHHGLALLGLSALVLAAFACTQPQWRAQMAERLSGWAGSAAGAATGEAQAQPTAAAQDALAQATLAARQGTPVMFPIADPSLLPRRQAVVTDWIAKRYRVAPELVARLVDESWQIGKRTGIDPTLLLAMIAVESRFNPFAQSAMGAEGLMQVMTHIHSDKYHSFGGEAAAFDPVANLQVGVKVLEEHIRRAGSLRGGLKQYVGASGPTDGGYADKVLAERERLLRVAYGPAEGARRAASDAISGTLARAPARTVADRHDASSAPDASRSTADTMTSAVALNRA